MKVFAFLHSATFIALVTSAVGCRTACPVMISAVVQAYLDIRVTDPLGAPIEGAEDPA
jgi:hypothetical protein